jgi:hypothetical protein
MPVDYFHLLGGTSKSPPLRLRYVENPHFSRKERARNGAPGTRGVRCVTEVTCGFRRSSE